MWGRIDGDCVVEAIVGVTMRYGDQLMVWGDGCVCHAITSIARPYPVSTRAASDGAGVFNAVPPAAGGVSLGYR